MDRRELLALLGIAGPAIAGLTPEQLFAVSRRQQAGGRSVPGILDAHQRALVDQVSEMIMPATDTPGARAAGVTDFVDLIVTEYYHDDERAAFVRGLADLDSRAQADFAKGFLDLAEPQQAAILTGMDAEARAMPPGAPAQFFPRIKSLTLYGYYTSEIGSREELHEVFMPGRFDGSAPLATGGR